MRVQAVACAGLTLAALSDGRWMGAMRFFYGGLLEVVKAKGFHCQIALLPVEASGPTCEGELAPSLVLHCMLALDSISEACSDCAHCTFVVVSSTTRNDQSQCSCASAF